MEDARRSALLWAAMLHDIGKFRQRSIAYQERIHHAPTGAEALEGLVPAHLQAEVGKLVASHHNEGEQPPLLKILRMSDWLSASEREKLDEEEKTLARKEPLEASLLENPLSKLQFEGNEKIRETTCFPLLALSSESVLEQPAKKGEISDYQKLWEGFVGEAKAIANVEVGKHRLSFSILNYLMEKYCWAIPSATARSGSFPDISLYDHCRLAASLAVCFYDAGVADDQSKLEELERAVRAARNKDEEKNDEKDEFVEKNEFLALIAGDISGIQKFIFRTGQGTKGGVSAKRLRGRSFMLKLITDAVAKRIMVELSLPEPCLLFSAGGRFTILAPNTDKTRDVVQKAMDDANCSLVQKYGGVLTINIAVVPMKVKEVREFQDVLREKVQPALEKAKQLKPRILFSDSEKRSQIESYGAGCEKCQICALPLKEKRVYERYGEGEKAEIEMCANCYDETLLGEKISHMKKKDSKYWQVLKENIAGGVTPLPNFDFSVCFERPQTDAKKACVLVNESHPLTEINVWEGADAVLFETAGTYWGRGKEGPMTYEEMAEASKAGYLGWLKMDVDNLGSIFSGKYEQESEGKEGRKEKVLSLSRYCFLSRVLEYFFKAGINKIMEKDCPSLGKTEKGAFAGQIIYSGGDDVLLVGNWEQVVPLALAISRKLDEFSGYSGVSVSAGISITPSKYPIGMAVEEAEENLKRAKEIGKNDERQQKKRAVALLGDAMQFGKKDGSISDSFDNLLACMEKLPSLLPKSDKEGGSKGFLRQLLDIKAQCEPERATRSKSVFVSHKHVPKIYYLLARHYKKDEAANKEEMREFLLEERFYRHLVVAVSMQLLLMREKRKKEVGD